MYRSRLAFALAMAALAAILLPSSLTAQITFQRTYGGASSDFGYSAQQTLDGGYIVAGRTNSRGAGVFEVYSIKTDARGDTLWTRTYGGAGHYAGYSVQQTADSGYIVAGGTRSLGVGCADVYLLKTDARGETLWTRTYGGAQDDEGKSVQQTNDGGYIIAGWTFSFSAGDCDAYLVRTDAHGDTLWTKTFGGPYSDAGHSVQQTSDGGYVIAGGTTSFGSGGGDAYIVKTDVRGDTEWTRTYGGPYDDDGLSVQQTSDGGYIVTGAIELDMGRVDDVYLIKTNVYGDSLWTRVVVSPGGGYGSSVQQTTDIGYIVTGTAYIPGRGNEAYLIRTNGRGDTLWTKTFGGDSFDYGFSVDGTADGGFIVAGLTKSFGAGGYDVYLIKTDSLGNVAVAEPKASPTRAPALSLSCEPNPFRTRTAISLQLTADSPAELAIFDASGRCVRTFTVNRTPDPVWDGKDDLGHVLPSGTYFVVLAAAGQHAAMRLVLQR